MEISCVYEVAVILVEVKEEEISYATHGSSELRDSCHSISVQVNKTMLRLFD